jgi:diacylglycerol kinase (ATP)
MTDAALEGAPAEKAGTGRGTGRMVVIWNASAGTSAIPVPGDDPAQRRQAVEDALAAHGVEAELFESPSEAEAEQRIKRAIDEGARAVVAAGGDGTVRSVAFNLLDRDIPLGILPMGTAMNVARSLGIPLELDGAAKVLADGHVRAIDVGSVRGQSFLEIASIGLGAEVLANATHVGEGRLRAALDMIKAAWRYRRTRVRLQLDGRDVRGHALMVAVANGPFTGRAVELAPDARIDDGAFDVFLYHGFGALGFGAHLARVLLGRPHDERIHRYRAATVRVNSRRPLPIRLDSQDLGTTPVELVTRPGALRVLAPLPNGDDSRP